jgi:hypothetical protein
MSSSGRPETAEILMTSQAGHFKSRDPSVSISTLARPVVECVVLEGCESGWMSTAATAGVNGLDIAAATSGTERQYGLGPGLESDACQDPEDVESTLISDYIATYGSEPFANQKIGRQIETEGG